MRRSVSASPSLPLAISVVVHALAALLLVRVGPWRPVTAPAPAPEPALEVELVETPPATEPGPEPAPIALPPTARAPEVPPPSPRPGPRPAPVRAPAPARSEPRAAPPADPPPATPAPRAAPPASPSAGSRGRPPVVLALDFRAIDRLTDRGVLARPEAPGGPPAPAAPRVSAFGQRLAARVREDGARRNVAAGKVHPQVFDYMRDARKVFAPDPGTVDLDPRTPNSVKNSLKQWGGGLREAYRSWRRELGNLNARTRNDLDRRGVPDILEHYNRILEGNRKGAEAIASQVCLLLAPGDPPRVELGRSSNNDEVDRAAIDALRLAARSRQPESDLARQRTCYRFEVKVVRVPPLPVAGCTFDEVALTASCYYPLKKAMVISVSVDGVDYDEGAAVAGPGAAPAAP